MTEFSSYFLRTNKRYLPPFRITYNRRPNNAPLLVKDARDVTVGSFTKWPYALACLTALHKQAGLPPPYPSIERRRFEENIWQQLRDHPNSKALQHINDGLVITKHSREFANRNRNRLLSHLHASLSQSPAAPPSSSHSPLPSTSLDAE